MMISVENTTALHVALLTAGIVTGTRGWFIASIVLACLQIIVDILDGYISVKGKRK